MKKITYLQRSKFQIFPFHIVIQSPWPIVIAFALISLALSLAFTMHGFIPNLFPIYLALFVIILTLAFWIRDIILEATYLGDHTIAVRKGIILGFILFMVSEIIIFAGLFWAYFHSLLSPDVALGGIWPPLGIQSILPTEVPLLNTIILLASGLTITWSHHALIHGKRSQSLNALLLTFWLITIFVALQYFEYTFATFTLTDGVYGSVFFLGTGLHFLHIIILLIILAVNYWRLKNYQMTSSHHVGFETCLIDLHILDIIWLVLYVVFYWWGL